MQQWAERHAIGSPLCDLHCVLLSLLLCEIWSYKSTAQACGSLVLTVPFTNTP